MSATNDRFFWEKFFSYLRCLGARIGVIETAASLTELEPSVDTELPAPDAGTVVGQRAKFYITPSAGITLTLDAAILIPTDSMQYPVFSKVLTSGLLTILALEWNGTAWMLTTSIGEY